MRNFFRFQNLFFAIVVIIFYSCIHQESQVEENASQEKVDSATVTMDASINLEEERADSVAVPIT